MDYGDVLQALVAAILFICGFNFQYLAKVPTFAKEATTLVWLSIVCVVFGCLLLVV
jgi:hypothetical protein